MITEDSPIKFNWGFANDAGKRAEKILDSKVVKNK